MNKETKITLFLILVVFLPAIAFSDPVSTNLYSKPINSFNSFTVEQSMGMASYSIPIEAPPGRKGLQPEIIVNYSSNNPNGWLGMGWNLNLGYIERSTKAGVPKYDSSDDFYISFRDFNSEVRRNDEGIYWPDFCPSYLKLVFTDNYWKAFDNQGNTYYFGKAESARISDTAKGTFRWVLDRIVDTCGNYITISYQAIEGQVYPSKIEYTGNEATGDLPTNSVEFILENRNDYASSFRSGFKVTATKRLRRIDTKTGTKLAKRYLLEYKYSALTNRSLLTKFTTYGSDGITALPAQTFFYQEEKPTYIRHLNDSPKGNVKWYMRSDYIEGVYFENANGILYPNGNFSDVDNAIVSWMYYGINGKGKWTWGDDSTGVITIDEKGNFSFDFKKDTAVCFSTYLYVNAPKTITIPATGNGKIKYFLNGDYDHPYDFSTPLNLKKGYNLFEITVYNKQGRNQFNLNFSITDNVDAMNSFEMMLPLYSGDFNGDGRSDLGAFGEGNRWNMEISQGDVFLPKKDWGRIGLEPLPNTIPFIGDFNGDGKTDVGYFSRTWPDYWWNISKSIGYKFGDTGGLFRVTGVGSNDLPVIGDFNGDGINDVGYYDEDSGDWHVGINDRSRPVLFISAFGGTGWSMHLGDFNGDGLTDAAVSDKNGNWKVALCDGTKFIDQGTWINNFGKDKVLVTLDFNNDGLCDIGYLDKEQGKIIFCASTGRNFKNTSEEWITGLTTSGQVDITFQAGDFNGDGLVEPFVFNPVSGRSELCYSKGKFPDLLAKVENGLGGSISLTYSSSSEYDNQREIYDPIKGPREGLPINIPLVSKIETSDGIGKKYVTHYNYKGGIYNYHRKEFLGFNYIQEIDNDGNITDTYYSQEKDFRYQPLYKMKPLKIEKKDSSGKLYEKIENTWGLTPFGGGGVFTDELGIFAYIILQTKYIYSEDGGSVETKIQYRYDDYGNMICFGNWGEVGLIGDGLARGMRYNYNNSPTGPLLVRPYKEAYSGADDSWDFGYTFDLLDIPFRWMFYDNNSNIQSPPTKGLLTKEVLAGDNSYSVTSAKNSIITYKYDSYGNIIEIKDAVGGVTAKVYDTAKTFPVETTNALGHKVQTTYDSKTGQVLSITDENNQKTQDVYDAIGRLIKVIGPNDSQQYPAIIYEYDLSKCPTKITTRKKISNNPVSLEYPDYLVTHSFYDGLGRLIQVKSPAEDAQDGKFLQRVSDTVNYDHRGALKEKYLPYLVYTSAAYSKPSSSIKKIPHTYDSLGRLIRIDNADGTYSTVEYNCLAVTKTDENNHQRRSTYDGLGRLVKQEEFNDTQVYTTAYKYNNRDDLTEIKDARENITSIQYDPLHRKVSMSDPDMGEWRYTYDKSGNLKTQKDAKGKTITFEYDLLNRLTKKAYPDGKSVIYYYDDASKSYCKGRLSYVVDLSGRADYYYDRLGREIKEKRVIDGRSYTIERTYNPQDQILSVKYPDGEIINYIYNKSGNIEKILGASSYVNNVNYLASGQISKIEYGNGTYTTYAYNAGNLRLSRLKTNNGALQNLQYQYDNVGNITRITDNRNTATQDFMYDNLNRLVRATGAYGTLDYSYDSIGNMLSKEGISYTYGQQGKKPHAVTMASDGSYFKYDQNGNMVYRKLSTDETALTYDFENRLVKSAPVSEETTINYDFWSGWNWNGWYLISFPALPADAKVLSVTNSNNDRHVRSLWPVWIDQVSRYNSTSKKFEHFINDSRFNQFDSFEPLRSYFIHLNYPCAFTFSGKRSAGASLQLKKGYNFVGTVSTVDINVEAALKPLKLGVDYSKVYRYNAERQAFEEYSAAKKEFTIVKPTEGLVVYSLKDITWSPPTPTNTLVTEFAYDYEGTRVKKTANGKTTVYIDNLYEKTDTLATNHIYLGLTRIATRSAAKTLYYHSDHIGSSNVITNSSGARVQLSEYKPYGELAKNTANLTHYYFTGKELDSSTGLYFYGARYYDPQLGRFITADPIEYSNKGIRSAGGRGLKEFLQNPQNFNRFTYCLNNPIAGFDPSGLLTIFIPGTFSSWGTYFSPFYMNYATKSLGDSFGYHAFTWTGSNTNTGRMYAALTLSFFINNYKFSEGEKLNIIGFSHGGNIAFMASQLSLNHKIDNLITLGTPIREYRPNMRNIGSIYNVYSRSDNTQTLGGSKYKFFNQEFGPAGRIITQNSTLNIAFDSYTHLNLTSVYIWDQIIQYIFGANTENN